MPDDKRLVDMGCSTAILAAFACGPEGAVVAAGIGVGQFFFDWFYPAAQTPTQFAPINRGILDNALETLAGEMTDADWKTLLDAQTDIVLTQSTKFWDIFSELGTLKINLKTFVLLDPQTIADCDAYFNFGAPNAYDLLSNARNLITVSSANDGSMTDLQVAEHYTTTTGLYCLIGSLMCAYLKAAVLWRRSAHLLPWLQYGQYLLDKKTWKDTPATTKKAHPTWEPRPVVQPSWTLLEWEEWAKQDLAVPKLLNEAASNPPGTLIAHCVGTPAIPDTAAEKGKPATKGLQVRMADNWKQCHDNIRIRLAKVSVTSRQDSSGTYYWVSDTEGSGDNSWESKSAELMNLRKGCRCGALIAFEWENSMGEFALSRVVEDDITKFGRAIQLWKAAAASVQFSLYDVVKGDTLSSIAAAQYSGHSEYSDKIFKFNRDSLSDANAVLVEGQTLMLPYESVLDDIL